MPEDAAEIPQEAPRDSARALRVLRGGAAEEMNMHDYLVGVLRAEMPASFEPEALRAQAVAARTYTLYKLRGGPIAAHPDADACDDVACCKAYQSAAEAAEAWGAMALYYEEKLDAAVSDTDGEILLYGGEPILAVFCSSTAGHTQNAGAVWQTDLPYLTSVSSPENEDTVPDYHTAASFPASEFRERFLASHPEAELAGDPAGWIGGIERSDAGFVTALRVGGVRVKGNELRTILSLRSPAFTVDVSGDTLTFSVTGYGHGVGMSQYGANALAAAGMDYREILAHYFPGTELAHAG